MVRLTLSNEEKNLLHGFIGQKLIKMRHDPLDKFGGSEVYGRVELFFENSVIAIDYDYTPYHLFGSPDDEHPEFQIHQITAEEAISALVDVKQIDVACNQTIQDIILVEDYSKVRWNGLNDEALILKAIILKLEDREIAFQGDFMIPFIEIIKKPDVKADLLPAGEEFYSDEEVTYQGSREFVSLAKPN